MNLNFSCLFSYIPEFFNFYGNKFFSNASHFVTFARCVWKCSWKDKQKCEKRNLILILSTVWRFYVSHSAFSLISVCLFTYLFAIHVIHKFYTHFHFHAFFQTFILLLWIFFEINFASALLTVQEIEFKLLGIK